jgi:hypothetical protein
MFEQRPLHFLRGLEPGSSFIAAASCAARTAATSASLKKRDGRDCRERLNQESCRQEGRPAERALARGLLRLTVLRFGGNSIPRLMNQRRVKIECGHPGRRLRERSASDHDRVARATSWRTEGASLAGRRSGNCSVPIVGPASYSAEPPFLALSGARGCTAPHRLPGLGKLLYDNTKIAVARILGNGSRFSALLEESDRCAAAFSASRRIPPG